MQKSTFKNVSSSVKIGVFLSRQDTLSVGHRFVLSEEY